MTREFMNNTETMNGCATVLKELSAKRAKLDEEYNALIGRSMELTKKFDFVADQFNLFQTLGNQLVFEYCIGPFANYGGDNIISTNLFEVAKGKIPELNVVKEATTEDKQKVLIVRRGSARIASLVFDRPSESNIQKTFASLLTELFPQPNLVCGSIDLYKIFTSVRSEHWRRCGNDKFDDNCFGHMNIMYSKFSGSIDEVGMFDFKKIGENVGVFIWYWYLLGLTKVNSSTDEDIGEFLLKLYPVGLICNRLMLLCFDRSSSQYLTTTNIRETLHIKSENQYNFSQFAKNALKRVVEIYFGLKNKARFLDSNFNVALLEMIHDSNLSVQNMNGLKFLTDLVVLPKPFSIVKNYKDIEINFE